jgi:N-dimethylarginine dimethylaminohydrolase
VRNKGVTARTQAMLANFEEKMQSNERLTAAEVMNQQR